MGGYLIVWQRIDNMVSTPNPGPPPEKPHPNKIADEIEHVLANYQGCLCHTTHHEKAVICFDSEWAVIIAALRAYAPTSTTGGT